MDLNETIGYNQHQTKSRDVANLIVFEGFSYVREIDLRKYNKSRLSFGRSNDNDIVISSSVVSRQHHGFFILEGDRVWIEDNPDSTNGILYKERPIAKKELKDGDIIRIDRVIKKDGNGLSGERQQDGEGVLFLFSREAEASEWKFFPIEGFEAIRIGRGNECDLRLNHPCVSKLHVIIERRNNQWIIIDNDSTNGVVVNGTLVQGRCNLYEKDVILLAGVRLVFTEKGIHYLLNHRGISVVAEEVVKQVGRNRLVICDHANLYVKPGELVAIIGGSGSGKSSLMNCLCGYSFPTSGTVKLNGEDLYENLNVFRNIIGFVPQEDIVFDNLTVNDMLIYTAKLRLPEDTSEDERKERIRKVVRMVELDGKEQTVIKKLSGGQKKRVSIAVELISDPCLLFLDEPTSGLDPGTEQSLMKTLQTMAHDGKTIVLVTHSTLQLSLCDKIAFMGKGGKLCFCGNYDDALEFFHKKDIIDIYRLIASEPDLWKNLYDRVLGGNNGQEKSSSEPVQMKKKSAIWQLNVLCLRNIRLIKNDVQRALLLFLQAPLLALLIYLVSDGEQFKQYEMTKSLLFALACSAFWIGTLNSIQEICKERTILKREYMTGVHLSSYVLAKLIVLGIVCAVQTACMTVVFVILLGQPEKGVFFSSSIELFITSFLTALSATAMGLFVSALFKNADRAMTVAPILLMPQILFSGMVFQLSGLTDKLSNIVTCKWAMKGYGTTANLNSLPLRLQQEGLPIEHSIDKAFEYTISHELVVWLVLFSFVALFSGLAILSLLKLKRQR